MREQAERRRAERLPLPRHCQGGGHQAVRLLDLSPAGARIAHAEPLPEWRGVPLDLPRLGGRGQGRAAVIWSHLAGRERGGADPEGLVYQSGLAFPARTPAEQAPSRPRWSGSPGNGPSASSATSAGSRGAPRPPRRRSTPSAPTRSDGSAGRSRASGP